VSFTVKSHNLTYIDCSFFIEKIFESISELNVNVNSIKEKDLRKLIFHYFIELLLKQGKNKSYKERPVYFIFKEDFLYQQNRFINAFTYVFKHIKKLLPVPLIVIENSNIFHSNNGELLGINNRIVNYYIKNKISTQRLRKYLEEESFYELIKVLQDVRNIKALLH
jgi:hypothetical protein